MWRSLFSKTKNRGNNWVSYLSGISGLWDMTSCGLVWPPAFWQFFFNVFCQHRNFRFRFKTQFSKYNFCAQWFHEFLNDFSFYFHWGNCTIRPIMFKIVFVQETRICSIGEIQVWRSDFFSCKKSWNRWGLKCVLIR